jgi:hypothetical protein
MNLGDLLEELRDNILHDKSDQVSGASDYYWSDATLIRYINEAQRRFARRSLILRDRTTAQCCQFVTVSNQAYYQLDPSVLAVLSVRIQGDQADIARAGHSAFDTYRTPDNYYFDPSQLSNMPPGKPVAYDTDEGIGADDLGSMTAITMRLYPPPIAPYVGLTVSMRVIRLPLVRFDPKNPDLTAVPEIPEDHHLNMLDWAGYLALRSPDLDVAGDNGLERAEKLAASFEQHVLDAKHEAEKKQFVPMLWGFGRNGFSWET